MPDLKMQHIIVMVALLVSLVGTLLILGKINGDSSPITGATAVVDVDEEIVQEEAQPQQEEYETVVRVVGSNQTEDT